LIDNRTINRNNIRLIVAALRDASCLVLFIFISFCKQHYSPRYYGKLNYKHSDTLIKRLGDEHFVLNKKFSVW